MIQRTYFGGIEMERVKVWTDNKNIYWVCGIIVAALFALIGDVELIPGLIFGFVIGLMIGWFVLSLGAAIALFKLDFKTIKKPSELTMELLTDYIKDNFHHEEIDVEYGNKEIAFTGPQSRHILTLDDSTTISISNRATLKARLKNAGKVNSRVLYRETMTILPLIHKVVEEASAVLR